jgi:hypothetical protein
LAWIMKVRGKLRFLLLWLLRRRKMHDDFIPGHYSFRLHTFLICLPPVSSSTFSYLCFLLFSLLATPVFTACLIQSNPRVRHHSSSQNARPSSRSQDPPKHLSTPHTSRRLATSSLPLPCTRTMELITCTTNAPTENTHTPSIFESRQDPNEAPSHCCRSTHDNFRLATMDFGWRRVLSGSQGHTYAAT